MLFPTLNFGLFFLVVFAAAWALRAWKRARTLFLVIASYFFYACWDWRFMGLLLGSTALNWAAGMLIARSAAPSRRKAIVGVAVGLDLVVLGVFKYFNFFMEQLGGLLVAAGLGRDIPFLSVAVPVGISFFTFHGISYVVDLYRGQLKQAAGFLDMLLYISFFPQLVAGPIVRAAHFLPQLQQAVDPRAIPATRAYLLIVGGLFKKVIVANYLATELVDDVFFDPARFAAGDLVLAVWGYAVQIYCDFSAYTDIAIGVAALFGYRFPQNFDQPYRAEGLRDFWRRWHISLSSWLRDYLYISLGGNTGDWRRYRNLMLTMLLGGLWHGAAWNFVIWGGLHGTALVAEHGWTQRFQRHGAPSLPGRILAVFVTFQFVCLTWIFFRAATLDRALLYLGGLADWSRPVVHATPAVLLLLFPMLAAHFLPADRVERLERLFTGIPVALQGALVGFCIIAIDSFGPSGVAPFIYFQF